MLSRWLPRPALQEGDPGGAFDGQRLLRRVMGDRQMAGKLLSGFLAEATARLDNLRRRVAEADAAGARMEAHTLKSAAAAVSAEELQALALSIERAGAAGQLDRCGELLPCAVEEFERVKTAVERSAWM